MEVLSDEIIDLVDSYDFNRHIVERMAVNSVASVDAAVFGALRDLPCSAVLTALNRLDKWFSKRESIERCICLLMLTDYVSCAYQHKWFYSTFNHTLTAKFVDNLFVKLWVEWQKMLGMHFINLPPEESSSVRKMLRISVDRFPHHFRHKHLLERIISLSENYSNQKPTVLSSNVKVKSADAKINSLQLSANPNQLTIQSMSEGVKGSTNSVHAKETPENDCDCQIISVKYRKISKHGDMTRYVVSKENTVSKNTFNGVKIEQNVNGLLCTLKNSQKNTIISDLEENVIDITDCDDECDKMVASVPRTKEPLLPKKLNAFDILMRKVSLKRKVVQ